MTARRAAVRLTVGALALAPLALVAPTVAATSVETTTTAVPDATVVDYGDTVDVAVDVSSEDDDALTAGTSTLYARPVGATRWTRVATTSSASFDYFAVRPRATTTYKVVYHGYSTTSATEQSFSPSTSSTFTVQVARTITYPSGGFDLTGVVRPDYAGRRIVVKVSSQETGGFRRYTRIRTDSSGGYKISLPRRSGEWFWSFIVKGDDRYLGTRFKWRTWAS